MNSKIFDELPEEQKERLIILNKKIVLAERKAQKAAKKAKRLDEDAVVLRKERQQLEEQLENLWRESASPERKAADLEKCDVCETCTARKECKDKGSIIFLRGFKP